MNCITCNTVLREGAKFCHMCGIPQMASSLPAITGMEWFSFVATGGYTLKYKSNTDLQICCNGRNTGYLSHYNDEENDNHYYDFVQNENDQNPIVRFIRTSQDLKCVNPVNGQVFFTWQRSSSALGELASGSKWQCGPLALSQSGMRNLTQWLPVISWLVATKYTIVDNGRIVGTVKGACSSFSNSKSVEISDHSRAWELLAVAIILSDDELG